MDAAVIMKLKLATRGLNLTPEAKRAMMDWYKDDQETIKNMEQPLFTLLVKQFCLQKGFITIHQAGDTGHAPNAEA